MLTSLVRAGSDSPDFIFRVLEELKNQGASELILHYGESEGIDDTGVDPEYRNVRLDWFPYGVISRGAGMRWQGKLSDMVTFDFGVFPTVLDFDAIKRLAPDVPGLFIYGDPEVVEFYKRQGSVDFRKWDK